MNTLATRAVLRPIEAGEREVCTTCGCPIKYRARHRARKVIANVYDGTRWDRVEQFHAACYEEAGEPHGEAR